MRAGVVLVLMWGPTSHRGAGGADPLERPGHKQQSVAGREGKDWMEESREQP